MLDKQEFELLADRVTERIIEKLSVANRLGTLEELLKKWELGDIQFKSAYETYDDGKIVILGDSRVQMNDLMKAIKQSGLDKDRFEFHLDYDKAQRFNYKKYEYNQNYRVILVGALPHSTHDKGNFGSPIEMMKKTPGFPRVIELKESNGSLKITSSNLKKELHALMEEAYIAV